jgi:ACDE family multidrug resistance protein
MQCNFVHFHETQCFITTSKANVTSQEDTTYSPEGLLRDPNLYTIFGITLVAVMGVSSVTPAFPKIARILDISTEQIGWLITAFTIPGIILTPILGMAADQIGRKRILLPSLLLFAIGGTGCAFTTDFELLLILRFVQGIGGAALGTINVTLIGDLYKGNRRSTAMGYNGSVLSIGTAMYPAIGGALALIAWYMPFFLSLLALPIALVALFKLDNPEPDQPQNWKRYLQKVWITLQSKTVVGLFAANFLTFILLYGAILTYFPVLLDKAYGSSSFIIGIFLTTSSFFTGLVSSQLGRLTQHVTSKSLIRLASLLYLAVFLMIPWIHNFWLLFVPIAIFGIAQGMNIPSILNLLTYQAPMQQRAAFLSVNWMILRSGQTVGPLLLGLAFSLGGLEAPFYAAIGVGVLLCLVVFTLLNGPVRAQANA